MHFLFRAALVAGLGLALTSCATRPPEPVLTAGPTSATPSVTPSATPSATVSVPPPTTPAAESIVLDGKLVGEIPFGAAEAKVEGLLTSRMGKPDEVTSGRVCELDDGSPWGRQLQYGSATIQFESAPKKGSSAPRKLSGWIVLLDQPLDAPLSLAPELPVNATFAELKKAHPTGKLEEVVLGDSSFWLFHLPNGAWYSGQDAKLPDRVGSGAVRTCE